MLSRTAQYALRALVYLARQNEDNYHQTQVVAEHLQVPSNYLGKILQKMARQHIVESQKGLMGGFRLARTADRISLYEILSAIDALPYDGGTRPRSGNEPEELVNLQRRFAAINGLYIKFLKETMLATVMRADVEATGTPLEVDTLATAI
jgi:Rrf2 family protein